MRRENNSINNSVLEMKSLLAKKYHMSCMKAREKKLKRKQRECVCVRGRKKGQQTCIYRLKIACVWLAYGLSACVDFDVCLTLCSLVVLRGQSGI